jgi:hypothetical protein
MEEEVQKLVIDIQQSAWEATPLITRRMKGNNYPTEVKEIIAEKLKIRKKVANNSRHQY